jgi:Fusaric acid resistance protein family
VAGYAPGTAPFVVGQAAFTVTVVVLFNLLVPAGWRVGLLRVEDVAVGCAVSIVVGALFWPRGASAVVGDNLADAFRSGARYLGDAASWALGESTERPDRAIAAIAAGIRLDDAVRGYLAEQGSKRLSKHDLWTLVMAAMRLRLTAHSLASLPGHNLPPPQHKDGIAARLLRQTGELTGFYERIAAQVGRPARGQPAPVPVPDPAPVDLSIDSADMLCKIGPAHYHPEALWVGHHLSDLAEHGAAIPVPAASLAQLRRTPWWRGPANDAIPAGAADAAAAGT